MEGHLRWTGKDTVIGIELAKELGLSIGDKIRLVADSWMKTNAELLVALSNQRMTSAIIQLFVIIAVALGIASVLAVSVVQRSRDIGILRAMGATPARILRVFLLQGGIVGLLGSIVGCGIGAALLLLFSQFARNADGTPLLPVALEPRLFLIASIVATLSGLLAAALPARRAARLDPVVAIRYGG